MKLDKKYTNFILITIYLTAIIYMIVAAILYMSLLNERVYVEIVHADKILDLPGMKVIIDSVST